MNTSKKIIKYLAMAFALFLAITIVAGILQGMYAVYESFRPSNSQVTKSKISEINTTINDINIDLFYSSLTIKRGNKLTIETNNNKITTSEEGNKLNIKEEKHKWHKNNKYAMTITIPTDIDTLDINMGAGTLNIDTISTDKLILDLGAGSTMINNINTNRANINTGAGSFTINKGIINDLDLDIGVGETNVVAVLTGNTKIDTGVGALKLALEGTITNYQIKVNEGIGKVTIDNQEVKDNEVVGSGPNTITLSGGLGDIEVQFVGR